jgi:transcriptional regulator with XRE-family HTH domain
MRSFKAAPEVLSAWMDERKLTAAELSRQTGIDAGILRKIMTGRETASTRNLMTLARYFGLSMQELIDAFSGQ